MTSLSRAVTNISISHSSKTPSNMGPRTPINGTSRAPSTGTMLSESHTPSNAASVNDIRAPSSVSSGSGKSGKVCMEYGLWNATSWYSGNNGEEAIKLVHLLHEMRKNKIEILGVLETWWQGQGYFTYQIPSDASSVEVCTYHVYYSGASTNPRAQGLAFILSDQANKKCIFVKNDYKETPARMMSLKIDEILFALIHPPPQPSHHEKLITVFELEKMLSKRDFGTFVVMGNFEEDYQNEHSIRKWCKTKGMTESEKQSLYSKHFICRWPNYTKSATCNDSIHWSLLKSDYPGILRGQLQIKEQRPDEKINATPGESPIDLHVNLLTNHKKRKLMKEIDDMTYLYHARVSESMRRSFGTNQSNDFHRKQWSSILLDKCMMHLHCAI